MLRVDDFIATIGSPPSTSSIPAPRKMRARQESILIIRKTVSRQFQGAETTPKFYVMRLRPRKAHFNTPTPLVSVVGLVTEWWKPMAGLKPWLRSMPARPTCSDLIDSDPRFSGHAVEHSRSHMNVTFRMESEAQERTARCGSCQHHGLRGHRSVGGLRASIYNAVAEDTVRYLRDPFVPPHRDASCSLQIHQPDAMVIQISWSVPRHRGDDEVIVAQTGGALTTS